jgi:indole-3-glycerol phosphate synthase
MSILDEILRRTRADVLERRAAIPLVELKARCRDAAPARPLAEKLRRATGGNGRRLGPIRVIAEVKKASPSKGVIRPEFAPADLARSYAAAGAHAISVLTDGPFFQGSLTHLLAVCGAVDLPILRKDFHVDPYQLWEARAAGADAILLITAALQRAELVDLLGLSRGLTLGALVEVHTPDELGMALVCGATLVGINNRDLQTFQVSLETTLRLLPRVPADIVLVSESGISKRDEMDRLAGAGVDAILVGEGLLRHADVGEALRNLVGTQ